VLNPHVVRRWACHRAGTHGAADALAQSYNPPAIAESADSQNARGHYGASHGFGEDSANEP
jgi:hypothetical protein